MRHVCLLCQARQASAAVHTPSAAAAAAANPSWQQGVRYSSSGTKRQRERLQQRKPARMRLSQDVAKPSLPVRFGSETKPRPRLQNSPFGGMNQTKARLRVRMPERPAAEVRRASAAKGRGEDSEKKGRDRPLFKALKMQKSLETVPYERRNAIKSKVGNMTSFDQFRLLPAVRESINTALPGMTDLTPTPIQRIAFDALLKGPKPRTKTPPRQQDGMEEEDDAGLPKFDQFLLAAETGSGKTLGYIVPVVNALKRAEIAQKAEEEKEEQTRTKQVKAKEKDPNRNAFELESPELSTPETMNVSRPTAIILLPTSELVNQVGGVVKQLSHTAKLRSATLSSQQTPRRIRNTILHPGGLDILVTTPQLISSIAESNPFIFSRVTHLVVDEADSLFDKSFSPYTLKIVEKTAPNLKQLILCSATIPRSLDTFMRNHFPEIRRLVTPNLHAVPRRVQLGVVDIDKSPYQGNRNKACGDVIWSLGKAGDSTDDKNMSYQVPDIKEPKSIMVFVNQRETADEVAEYLKSKGVDAVALSRDMPQQRKAEVMSDFTVPKTPPSPEDLQLLRKPKYQSDIPFVNDSNKSTNHNRLDNIRVLVVTDLGSRGIDTIAVKTVILYDVPHTSVDFIHRLGRVGRMNRRGRGIVLVGKKDRKDVVREVREAMFMGQALI